MNRRPSSKIVAAIACSVVFVGVAPLAYIAWFMTFHNLQPLSVPLVLKRGEYASPVFKTDLDGTYQISLDWTRFPSRQTEVNLDWEIVDTQGAVIQHGVYKNQLRGGNIVELGEYRPKQGLRQRIILNIYHDVQDADAQTRLEIGLPEAELEFAEGYLPLAVGWAGTVTIFGVALFLFLMMRRRN